MAEILKRMGHHESNQVLTTDVVFIILKVVYVMTKKSKKQSYALCIENRECEDLEKRKIYAVLPDNKAAKEGYLRIIDESGEDYLYPESYFILVELPREAHDALQVAS